MSDAPKAGDKFQVGSNYSGETRKIAEVVRTERMANGDIETVVKDQYGYEQRVKANNNALPGSPYFSK